MAQLKDYFSELNNPINKPQQGLPASPSTSINLPTGSISSNPVESSPLAPIDIEGKRIGDWYFDNRGVANVVEGSMTDINRKYSGVVSANPVQQLSVRNYINAGASAIAGNQVAGPVGAAVAGIKSLMDAKQAYYDQYLNQDVEIVKAYNVVEDENGDKKVFLDTDKMAQIGSLAGEGIKPYTDTSKTDLQVKPGGSIDITVSTAFANSDEYQDAVNYLNEMFKGREFSQEVARQVANEETGATYEDVMRDYIKGAEADFYYKAVSVAEFKKIAPNASEDALELACHTQSIGGLDSKTLEKTEITIYNENNEKETVNAQEYLEKIKDMSHSERNDYMLDIGNKVKSSIISDDEKVILKAQANALYGVSNNENSGFKDLYRDDLMDSIADVNMPIFGRIGDLVGVEDLETFEQNELYGALFDIVSIAANMKGASAVTNIFEKGVRAGASALGKKAGGKVGNFLENINELAPNGERVVRTSDMSLGSYAARSGAQLAAQVAADIGYDGLEWAVHKATGQDFDFVENLVRDFAMDSIMTYGPKSYYDAVHNEKRQKYRWEKNVKTGKYELVELTPEIRAQQAARRILDASNGKASIKNQEMWLNKNAAMSNVAAMVLEVAPRAKRLFQKAVRLSGDIDKVTDDIRNEFETSSEKVQQDFTNFNDAVYKATGGKSKNFTKADMNYINAKVNRRRFVRMAGDNKKRVMQVVSFYKPSIEGVSKERAKQLDEVLGSMEVIIRDSVDFYKERGLISEEEYDRMVNSDVYKNGEFFPVWSSKNNYKGGDIMQSRRAFAEVKDDTVLHKVEDFDDPIETFTRFIDNQMRNVALQERVETILEIASIPGSRISIVSDVVFNEETGKYEKADADESVLGETSMLQKYEPRFKAIYNKIVKRVDKDIKTEEEHTADNSKAVMNSAAMGDINKLKGQQEEETKLRGEVSALGKRRKKLQQEADNLRAEGQRIYNEGWTGNELEEISNKIASVEEKISKTEEDMDWARFNLARNRNEQQETIEDLYENTLKLLAERDKENKYAPKVEIESLRIKEGIENALKIDNKFGALQMFLNVQVEAVNPYVSRESAIRAQTATAAAKFRKTIIKEEREQRANKKASFRRINAAADRVLDVITKGLDPNGSKEKSEKVDEENMAGFLSTYDQDEPRTIRYYVDGKQHHVTLEGQGVEALVAEMYAPELSLPTTTLGKIGAVVKRGARGVARAKRTLTTAIDVARVLPNLMRDWTRGIVSTGGLILLDPDALRRKAIETGKYTPEEVERINNAFLLARSAVSKSTLTQSLEGPRRNVTRQIIRQSREGAQGKTLARRTLERKDMTREERMRDLPSYTKAGFLHFRTEFKSRNIVEKLSMLQDWAETYTRKKAMDTAYYAELAAAAGRGETVDEQIASATEAAFFAGREATNNFARRGKIIQVFSQMVPYLSQKFSSPQSLALAYMNDPVGVANSMKMTTGAYAAAIAIALSNEESRKRYYLLSEYDRANNIVLPLTNDTIVTIPLDENVAAFLTPYRRIIEALEGNDPSGFYLWGADFFEALSPIDLSGFSEGDKFNIQRGFEKAASAVIPTIFMPFIENMTGRDWYYGTDIKYDAERTGIYYDNPDPTAGEMTSRSKNSKTLAGLANFLGVPQWKLQNLVEEFGGNIGQYALSALDKLQGATEEETGGREAMDAVFRPFTGADSNNAKTQFYDGVNRLNDEKAELKRKIASINKKLEAAAGDEKVELQEERQKLISDYGLRVTKFVDQYLSAFEITGGLSAKEANTVYHLYDVHGEASNVDTYESDSLEAHYNDIIRKRTNKRTTALAAESGIDKYVNSVLNPYHETYGAQALKNSINGIGADVMAKAAAILEDTSDYDNSYTKLKSDIYKRYDAAMDKGDYDTANAIAYEYDLQILRAIAPKLQEAGLEQALKNSTAVTDYLEPWIIVPSNYYKTANGRWLSKLPEYVSKDKAYNRRFILDVFGLLDEED